MKVGKAKKDRPIPQAQRFIEAAREAGCSEDEAEVRESLRLVVAVKPKGKD